MSRRPSGSRRPGALWITTNPRTLGGVPTYISLLKSTPLWSTWSIRQISTHDDGSAARKLGVFAAGTAKTLLFLTVRRPAVVHIHMASKGSFIRKSVIAGLARTCRVPTVIHIHAGTFADFYGRSPRPLQAWIRRTLEGATRVVALGASWQARLQAIAPRAHVMALPNPVHVGERPSPAEGRLQVVCLGRISTLKGTHVLLEAWARLGPAAGRPRLIIAGKGDIEAAGETVRRLGLGESVDILPWQSPDEVQALLAASHVLVLPSLAEGQPMVILEAMARGLCVVATDVGGIPDLIEHDVNGLMVPASDPDSLAGALQRVLADPAERARLAIAGHARVRAEHDLNLHWKLLDALYRDLAASR